MKLSEYLKEPKKVRKCPHCKSNKGYTLRYSISGSGSISCTFSGKELNSERDVFDKFDTYGECVNCGKSIASERLKTD